MNFICVAIVHAYSLAVLDVASQIYSTRRAARIVRELRVMLGVATSTAAEPAGEGCRANIITIVALNMAIAAA